MSIHKLVRDSEWILKLKGMGSYAMSMRRRSQECSRWKAPKTFSRHRTESISAERATQSEKEGIFSPFFRLHSEKIPRNVGTIIVTILVNVVNRKFLLMRFHPHDFLTQNIYR